MNCGSAIRYGGGYGYTPCLLSGQEEKRSPIGILLKNFREKNEMYYGLNRGDLLYEHCWTGLGLQDWGA